MVVKDKDFPFNADAILTDEEMKKTKSAKNYIKNYFKKKRDEKNLPAVPPIELPEIADKLLMQELAVIFLSNKVNVAESRVLTRLNNKFVENTSCLNTLIASY